MTEFEKTKKSPLDIKSTIGGVAKEFCSHSLEDTQKAAEYFAKFAVSGQCFALYGTLGVGKTTFSQFLIKTLLPSVESVSSPTFTIVQTYEGIVKADNATTAVNQPLEIWHVDCYRLKNADEFFELGLEEAFETCVTIIEWPEIIRDFLPKSAIHIHFSVANADNGQ